MDALMNTRQTFGLKLGKFVKECLLQVSIVLSGGARESADNVSELLIGLNKGIMGWENTNLDVENNT